MVADDVKELEKRMRRKLLSEDRRNKQAVYTDEQRSIARKLVGTAETQRLENRRGKALNAKLKRPLVTAEHYWVPADGLNGGWTIDVRVDGRIHNSAPGMTRDVCQVLIDKLRRRGIQIKPIITERMKQLGAHL